VAEALVRQILPSEFFIVKEPPSFDADSFIVEEGLLTQTEQKILRTLVELGIIILSQSSVAFAASARS